jgi:hypothetical protein
MMAQAWTEGEAQALIPIYKQLGGYAEHGTARCVFCRPTDAELAYLLETGAVPPDHTGLYSGPNIWSLHWWSSSLRDSLALARMLLATIPAGAAFAWHSGEDRRVFRKKRGAPCPLPSP